MTDSGGVDTPPCSGAGAASPDVPTHAPQPRRPYPGALPKQTSGPNSPDIHSPLCGADEELSQIVNGKDMGQMIEGGARPLSSVSTCAGTTPNPEGQPSPSHRLSSTSMAYGLPEKDLDAQNGLSQSRKVFVGGVPQDMNEEDLRSLFAGNQSLKKAWLQRHRPSGGSNASPPHNHRGFGFVIFHDAAAVDELLGGKNSIFIILKDGKKLEVKRAVSSNEIKEGRDGEITKDAKDQQQRHQGQRKAQAAQPSTPNLVQVSPPAQTPQAQQQPAAKPWATVQANPILMQAALPQQPLMQAAPGTMVYTFAAPGAMPQAMQPAMQSAMQPAMQQAMQPAMQTALHPAMHPSIQGQVLQMVSQAMQPQQGMMQQVVPQGACAPQHGLQQPLPAGGYALPMPAVASGCPHYALPVPGSWGSGPVSQQQQQRQNGTR